MHHQLIFYLLKDSSHLVRYQDYNGLYEIFIELEVLLFLLIPLTFPDFENYLISILF